MSGVIRRYIGSYPPLCEESSPLWLESAGVVSGVPSSLCLDPANRSASRYEAQLPYKSFEKPGSNSRFFSAAGGRAAKRTSEFSAFRTWFPGNGMQKEEFFLAAAANRKTARKVEATLYEFC